MATTVRTGIADEMSAAWARFRSTVDQLASEHFDRPMAGGWTPKQMLGHMAFWSEAVEPVVVAMLRGEALRPDWAFGSGYEPDEGQPWPPADVHNEREARWAADRSVTEVLARLDAAGRRAIEVAATVTPQELDEERFRSYFREKIDHLSEHRAELVQLLQGRGDLSKLVQSVCALDREASLRLLTRVAGMTDDEYLWEPVPACSSVRQSGDRWVAEWAHPESGPPPLTTIAARMWHLGARPWPVPPPTSAEAAVERFFAKPYLPDDADPHEACGTAAEALASLRTQWHDREDEYARLTEAELLRVLGPVAHRYADGCYYDLLLHIIDERIHHAAEVGLLRDLYRARRAADA